MPITVTIQEIEEIKRRGLAACDPKKLAASLEWQKRAAKTRKRTPSKVALLKLLDERFPDDG